MEYGRRQLFIRKAYSHAHVDTKLWMLAPRPHVLAGSPEEDGADDRFGHHEYPRKVGHPVRQCCQHQHDDSGDQVIMDIHGVYD
jgi:hypothetical protein